MLSFQNVMYENKITERHLKTCLDIAIMAILTGESAHGYEIIATLHKEFGILLSPGSLYPLLHCLEDDKLIESSLDKDKVVYRVTSAGKEKFGKAVDAYNFSIDKLSHFVKTHGESLHLLNQETEENTVNTSFDK
jgi:DNA-binding PadR family transcriptional regulator